MNRHERVDADDEEDTALARRAAQGCVDGTQAAALCEDKPGRGRPRSRHGPAARRTVDGHGRTRLPPCRGRPRWGRCRAARLTTWRSPGPRRSVWAHARRGPGLA